MENQFELSHSGYVVHKSHTEPPDVGDISTKVGCDSEILIDDATSILMQRLECNASDAFAQLQETAQRTNGSILEVAIELVQSGAADADPDLSDVLGG